MLRNIVRSAVQNVPRTGNRSYSLYGPANYKPPSIDDMPVPQGSWQKAYDKRQTKYNMHLIGGIAFTIATIVIGRTSGCLYLNWSVPTPKEKKE